MKLVIQPVKRGADIFHLTLTVMVGPFAQSGAAKIKAQRGKSQTVQRLHGVEHNLVVHGAAMQWVRMAHQSGVRRMRRAGVQQCFQLSRGSGEKEALDLSGH